MVHREISKIFALVKWYHTRLRLVWYHFTRANILRYLTLVHGISTYYPMVRSQNNRICHWIFCIILWLDHRTIEFAIGYFAVFNAEYQQCWQSIEKFLVKLKNEELNSRGIKCIEICIHHAWYGVVLLREDKLWFRCI